MKRYALIFITAVMAFCQSALLGAETIKHPSIVSALSDSALVDLIQPQGLADRLLWQNPTPPKVERKEDSRAGFRIQIYSDNNARTAKNNARARIRQVTSRFPQYRSYLDYYAPYWKARVGDFKQQKDAQEAALRIRSAFPSFGKEVRVVPDRISIFE